MKKLQIAFAGIAVVLLLSGCGRHKDKTPDAGNTQGGTTGGTPGGTQTDFVAFTKQLFTTSDTEEPADIETTTFTGVETDDETAFDSLVQ